MRRRLIITNIMAILILICMLSPTLNAAAQQPLKDPIQAELIRVIDGSEIEVRVTLADNQHKTLAIKLKGIDAPKFAGACPEERALALKAKTRLDEILHKHLMLSELIELENSRSFMAQVRTFNGIDPVENLTSEILVRLYWGGHIFGWCKDQTICLTQDCKQYDNAITSK